MTSEMVESDCTNIRFFLYQLDPEVRRPENFKKETIRNIQPNLVR